MDILGVFDSVTFAAIKKTPESRGTGRTMTKWKVNILQKRNIRMSYQGENMEKKVRKSAYKVRYCHPFYNI